MVITDTSIETNLYQLYEYAAKNCGAEISSFGNLSYISHGTSAWPQMIYSRSGHINESDLQLLSQEIITGAAPRTLLLNEMHYSGSQLDLLKVNRFIKATEWVNMYLPSGSLKAYSAPLSIEIAEISENGLGELQDWISIVSKMLFNGKELSEDLFLRGIKNGFLKLFLAKINEYAAATTLLYWGRDTAGVYMVATLPQYQRIGLGAAIMKKTIEKAAELKCPGLVLQSTQVGLPFYKRLGFQMCNKLAIYFSLLKN